MGLEDHKAKLVGAMDGISALNSFNLETSTRISLVTSYKGLQEELEKIEKFEAGLLLAEDVEVIHD